MSDDVIVAIIGLISTLIVALLISIFKYNNQTRQLEDKIDSLQDLMSVKIDDLSKRVEKHNNVIERVYRLEENTKNMNHRLENLEKK